MIQFNHKIIDVTMFSDNTSQVWKLPDGILNNSNYAVVEWEFEHEGEFMHLAQLKDLLDKHHLSVDLYLKYLPYARQDKDVDNYQTFALISFSRLLNFLSFNKIIIVDPHSEKALDLIENSEAIYPHDRVAQAIKKTDADLICYPDAGATLKYKDKYPYKYISATKLRDQLTGNIVEYGLNITEEKLDGKSILIVDDICDGGNTFIKLSKKLYENGAKEVNLFVTHGIFSAGLKPLFDANIKRIITINGEQK